MQYFGDVWAHLVHDDRPTSFDELWEHISFYCEDGNMQTFIDNLIDAWLIFDNFTKILHISGTVGKNY